MSYFSLFSTVPWSVDELWDSIEILIGNIGTIMNGALAGFVAITGVYILIRIVLSVIH